MRFPALLRPSLRRPAATVGALALLATIISCADLALTGPGTDFNTPTVKLTAALPTVDTAVAFTANMSDNLGLKSLRVRFTGATTVVLDTVFTTNVTALILPVQFGLPRTVPPGSVVRAIATVTDGAGNVSRPDTARLMVGNLAPARVKVIAPLVNAQAVAGKGMTVQIQGTSGAKVARVGYVVSGAFAFADSGIYRTPLADSVVFTDTLQVPAGVATEPLTITPFVVDSLSQRLVGTPVLLTITQPVQDTSSSVVVPVVARRIEVRDTLKVTAMHGAGITTLGYEMRTQGGTIIVADSVQSTGNLVSLSKTFSFDLKDKVTTFPTTVIIQGFARNSNGIRNYGSLAPGVTRADTAMVVAGLTVPLPTGGQVADAIYHAGKDAVYLTNIQKNHLEVFNLGSLTFRAPIVTGSRPWGIAAWPRNRGGQAGDTLVVANSGGTSLSYIDLNRGLEVFRYPLPNIIVNSVTSVKSTLTGQVIQQRTRYDFSDRPQFVAMTCKSPTGGACTDMIAVYSTTATPGQTVPFSNQGTIRWENLTRRQSHLFWEQASGQVQGGSDTLEIIRFATQGVGADSVLLPYQNPILNIATGAAILDANGDTMVTSFTGILSNLAFRDTTFVRNSGNFRRAIFGEGGAVINSRALSYDADAGLDSTFGASFKLKTPVRDMGISRAVDVTDYIANTASKVRGVTMNFDGALGAIRGDSTYIVDSGLRLQGLLQTSSGNPGFAFHPQNATLNSSRTTRLSFAASTLPQIEVYDTHCYQRVSVVPVRDPIIGPITSALRGTGEIVLVGATVGGVITVTLPNTFTTTCP